MLPYKKLQDFKEPNLPGSGVFSWKRNHPYPNKVLHHNHIKYYQNSKNPSQWFLKTNASVSKEQQISQKRPIPLSKNSIQLPLIVTLQLTSESWGGEGGEYIRKCRKSDMQTCVDENNAKYLIEWNNSKSNSSKSSRQF